MSYQESKLNQATQIAQLIAHYPVFHDQDHRAFISVVVRGHTEHWAIDSEAFQSWLTHQYFCEMGQIPNKSAIKDAIAALKGRAIHEGPKRQTFLRAGYTDGAYYLDLGGPDWQAVEITRDGWRVIDNVPVAFRRGTHQGTLPNPERDGSLDTLWMCININPEDQLLVLTWLLDSLRPNTNYPILLLEGEQGSAKSTTQRLLKQLLDPSAGTLRTAPKNVQDMFVAAGNDYLLSFNNLSFLSADQQDALCNMATGGSFATRTLFTNECETIINVQRPVMMNGISALASQQDLLERCLFFDLPVIPERARQAEDTINGRFSEHQGRYLGALLDIFVLALRSLTSMPRRNLPRMADFAMLGRAVAIAQGEPPEKFDSAYRINQQQALEHGLESSPIYTPLREWLSKRPGGFYGTFAELQTHLQGCRQENGQDWPKSARAMATEIKRLAAPLRKMGISVAFSSRQAQGYCVALELRD